MQFDDLCALVGALRDRVAELEAKEAARAGCEAEACLTGDGSGEALPPITYRIDGVTGNAEIQAMVAAGVAAGYRKGRGE